MECKAEVGGLVGNNSGKVGRSNLQPLSLSRLVVCTTGPFLIFLISYSVFDFSNFLAGQGSVKSSASSICWASFLKSMRGEALLSLVTTLIGDGYTGCLQHNSVHPQALWTGIRYRGFGRIDTPETWLDPFKVSACPVVLPSHRKGLTGGST